MKKNDPELGKQSSANERIARENRVVLDDAGVFAVNLMSAPGAGRTTLIWESICGLKDRLRVGVIEGSVTARPDSLPPAASGAIAVHVNTGGKCRLDARMLRTALVKMDLHAIDLLLVENIGSLVCPAGFTPGTHRNVLVASTSEGDETPFHYPGMYSSVDVVVINKTDLLPYVPFRMDHYQKAVTALNPGALQLSVSCQTGAGMHKWLAWLKAQVKMH